MFQTFDEVADPSLAAERIAALRRQIDETGLDGFLVPRADEHQGEYVPPRAERLKWLTGFSGSAGMALVLRDRALIFVDGRYTLQVREQTDGAVFDYEDLIATPPARWLRKQARSGLRIGFDPWLHTIAETRKLATALDKAGAKLVAVRFNPVDEIWHDRPKPPLGEVDIQEQRFAGRLAREKLADMAGAVRDAGASHTVLTDASSVAWAFNIRGSDVPHTPLALAFAIVGADGLPDLFIDKRKLPMKVEAYLTQLCNLRPPSEFDNALSEIAAAGATIGLDEQLAAEKLRIIVDEAGGSVVAMADPARLARATKNEAEIAGTRAAHLRDGAAMVRFLCWLDGREPGTVDEIGAAKQLETCRQRTGEETQMELRDISFDTISGAGPDGAIIHYRVTTATNRMLSRDSLYLVDSGAQYVDGTTDITRTILIGEASGAMRRHYTIVLKGMIGISLLRFPRGTRGSDIDAVARLAHWKAGLDYAHGTGHGVGSFLSVHEGPQRIARTGTEPLLAGMILSNEPGYYREGHYGIRLENLVLVEEAGAIDGGEIDMHGFETLTLAPFDRRLIDETVLTGEERDWLNAYHDRVLREVGPMLEAPVRAWLNQACAPL
ncbi:MAG: aminopeptidase P family protein [Rhizobiaceae bacterium]